MLNEQLLIELLTDQNISKGTESVHAKLGPLVREKNIFQPLVYHRVDFLESVSSISKKERVIKRDRDG